MQPPTVRPTWQTLAVHLMFFGSGAASLICQVVWFKQLQFVLGSSTFSVSVTVGSFFFGLSIGSLLGGRLADRVHRLLAVYGGLEFVLGGVALAITFLLSQWMAWVGWLAPLMAPESATARPLTVLLAFIILLPPTALMGATLPLLAKHLVRARTDLAEKVGFLYGINTLGAAFGCALVGFVLIGWLGVWQSALVASLVYVAVAGTAGFLAVSAPATAVEEAALETPAETEMATTETEPASQALILVAVFGLSGFVSVAYEVIWFRILINTGAQQVYAFSGMLAVYLVGLVLGSLICARYLAPRKDSLLVNFARLQLLIATACVLSLGMLGRARGLLEKLSVIPTALLSAEANQYLGDALGFVLLCAAVLIVPTTLIGIGFPLASELTIRKLSALGGRLGLLYSCNTLGGVLGSLAAGFLFLPLLGSHGSLVLLAGVNIALFALIVGSQPGLRRSRDTWREGIVATLGITVAFVYLGSDYLKRELTIFSPNQQLLSFQETPDATIVVLGYDQKETGKFQQLVVNGRSYANNILPCRRYMGMLAHLPTLLNPKPENALVICVGTGTTVGSTTTHESLRNIYAVDLCRDVFDVAPLFEPLNHAFQRNPRVKSVVADGRHFLLTNDQAFDILTFEPPPPHLAGVVNLYSQEFYQLAKKRMRPGGVLAQWVPLRMPRPILSNIMLRAMCEEFPHVSLWLPNSMEGIAIASMEPLRIDVAQLAQRMAEPAVQADLHNLGIDSPEDILAMFVAGDAELKNFIGAAPTVTDDRPRLEYYSFYPAGRTVYEDIARARQPVEPYLLSPVDPTALRRSRDIIDTLWREHDLVEEGQIDKAKYQEACKLIRAALQSAPANAYLKHRLAFIEANHLSPDAD